MKIEDADDRDHWNITVEVAKNLGSKKKVIIYGLYRILMLHF